MQSRVISPDRLLLFEIRLPLLSNAPTLSLNDHYRRLPPAYFRPRNPPLRTPIAAIQYRQPLRPVRRHPLRMSAS